MYVFGCKLITRCLSIVSILILQLLFNAGFVQAAEDPPSPDIINQATAFDDSQIRRQNERDISEERQRSLQEEPVLLVDPIIEDTESTDTGEQGLCFSITRVNVHVPESLQVEGSGIPEELKFVEAVAATYKDRCINISEISIITLGLLKHTTARGFTTTRFFIPEQDLRAGELQINMVPGRLNKITIAGQSSQVLAKTIFRHSSGQILNIREIEQGLEQLKRLHNINSTISLNPSANKAGYTDVVVSIDESQFWQSFISTDNSGTNATGDVVIRVNTNLANLAGMAEKITLGVSKDSNNDSNVEQQSFSLGFNIPFKYITAQYSYSGSEYSQYIGINDTAVSSGESRSDSVSINADILRDQTSKLSSKLTIARTSGRSFINDTEIIRQKKTRASATFNVTWKKYYGSQIYNVAYSAKQGTSWFGAQQDAADMNSQTPTYEYLIHIIDVSAVAPLTIFGLKANYLGVLRGQYTDDRVYASEFFSIGSRYSVRGFGDESALAAEGGLYFQNELSMATKSRLLTPYLGLDGGMISGPSEKNALGDYLVGGFVGLKGVWAEFSYNLFYAKDLRSPKDFEVKGSTIGASLNYVLN
jgi:hemolysin activation/secretion protein